VRVFEEVAVSRPKACGRARAVEKCRVFRRSAPLSSISLAQDRCLPAHRSLSPQWSRPLAASKFDNQQSSPAKRDGHRIAQHAAGSPVRRCWRTGEAECWVGSLLELEPLYRGPRQAPPLRLLGWLGAAHGDVSTPRLPCSSILDCLHFSTPTPHTSRSLFLIFWP
jgi:hypothetical protein